MPYKDKVKQKKSQHESYLRNKDRVCENVKKRKRERLLFLTKEKSKIGCKFCGEKRGPILLFHHKNGNDKKYGIAESKLLARKKLFEEIEKCDVLCQNCHVLFHWNEKEKNEKNPWLF